MTSILVIGATLAAFEFCSFPQPASLPPLNCIILDPGAPPSENVVNFFDLDMKHFNWIPRFANFELNNATVKTSCCGFLDRHTVKRFMDKLGKIVYDKSWVGNETVGDLLVDEFPVEADAKEFLNLVNRRLCVRGCDSSLYEVTLKDFKASLKNLSREKSFKNFLSDYELVERKIAYKKFQENVLYNKQIRTIDYTEDQVIIECADGTIYSAPLALYTLPLGVLKNTYKSVFKPALPQRKINAIQGFCTTSTNRIAIEFESCLSADVRRSRSFLWRDSKYKELEGSNLEWVLGISGFQSDTSNANKLVGFNIGHYSRQMETQTSEQLKAGFEFLLRHFYDDLPPIRSVSITRVNSHPATMGGLSFNCVAADLFEATRDDLAIPAFNLQGAPKLFFAGEATSKKGYGTVMGEISSGVREKARVYKFLSDPSSFVASGENGPLPPTHVQLVDDVDVLVLGAGSAGIAAARNLAKNSTLRFLVLEGYHQHGGRTRNVPMVNINSAQNETKIVFAGAQWLHAVLNPLYNFAEEKGLLVQPDSKEGAGRYYREDGYRFDDDFSSNVTEIADEIFSEAERFYLEGLLPYPENLQVYVRGEFEKYIAGFDDEDKVKARQILGWHELWNTIDWAAPEFKDISARNWGQFQWIDGSYEHKNLVEGAWGLLRDMIADIGGHQFIYNKVVTKICGSRGHNIGGGDGTFRKVLVKVADGTIYASDYVIPTFSLGVLKHDHLNMFIPKIPRRHANFIKCSGFFSITKFFIEFPYRWFHDEKSFNYVYENRDPDPSEWRVWINGFDKIFAGLENTLLGWAGGLGQFELEKLADRDIIDHLIDDMRNKFLSKTNFTVPDPIRYFISHWLPNPLTRGCYSFPSAACDCPGLGQIDLIRPIRLSRLNDFQDTGDVDIGEGAPVLLFAGEGASVKYFSTLHGAHYTGIDQTNVIIESVKGKK